MSKRIETHGGIVDPHGGVDVVQCVNALSGVAAGIAAILWRRRQERFRCRWEPKLTSENVIRTDGMLVFIVGKVRKNSPACRGYSLRPQSRSSARWNQSLRRSPKLWTEAFEWLCANDPRWR